MTAAHDQFMRKATLLIGNDSDAIDLSQMHFRFSIKQADKDNPQTAMVRIYNLSKETVKSVKEYTTLLIQAGYQNGAFGQIFNGEVIQAKEGRESAVDSYLDVLAAEGYSAHQAGTNVTLAAGATMLDLAKAAAAAMGLNLVSHLTTAPPALPRGTAVYGMARDALTTAAAAMGASWFYSPEGVELVALDGSKSGDATVMNANSGMIGWPEQTQDGVKLRCLLNPNLGVGSRLQIDNASIQMATISTSYTYIPGQLPNTDPDGFYRIFVIEHHGDTRGQEWYSDIVCLSLDAANWNLSGLVQKAQL